MNAAGTNGPNNLPSCLDADRREDRITTVAAKAAIVAPLAAAPSTYQRDAVLRRR
jgi:hypothetical protein